MNILSNLGQEFEEQTNNYKGSSFSTRQMSRKDLDFLVRMVYRWHFRCQDRASKMVARGWECWLNFDHAEQERQRQLELLRRANEAYEVLAKIAPGARTAADLAVVSDWGRDAPALSELSAADMDVLFQTITITDLQTGEPLFFQGSLGDFYWIILRGSLSLFVTDDAHAHEKLSHYRAMPTEELIQTQELLDGVLGNQVCKHQWSYTLEFFQTKLN